MDSLLDTIKYPFVQLRNLFRILFSANRRFIFFFTPGHYYSPIPDIHEIRQNEREVFDTSHKEIAGVELNEAAQADLLKRFASHHEGFTFPADKGNSARYYYDNSYYGIGDGMILYSMLRHFKPARIVEIGSGFSSALMLDVDDQFLGGKTDFTFIEPDPRRLLKLISVKDRERCRIIDKIVQNVSEDTFQALDANDFLFIDSSHVAKTHSDLLHLVFRVLPALKPGVIIHVHDIFWPFEYPKEWFEAGRAWNEAYFFRAFLQFNSMFKILYFNSFMRAHHADLLKASLPSMLNRPSKNMDQDHSSLWLKKTA